MEEKKGEETVAPNESDLVRENYVDVIKKAFSFVATNLISLVAIREARGSGDSSQCSANRIPLTHSDQK